MPHFLARCSLLTWCALRTATKDVPRKEKRFAAMRALEAAVRKSLACRGFSQKPISTGWIDMGYSAFGSFPSECEDFKYSSSDALETRAVFAS